MQKVEKRKFCPKIPKILLCDKKYDYICGEYVVNMRNNEKQAIIKVTEFDKVINPDKIDEDVFIFDDIKSVTVDDTPVMIEMPIFVMCVKGSATVELNLKKYEVTPDSLVTLMPDHIMHGYKSSHDFKGLFIAVSNRCVDELIPDILTALPAVMTFRNSPVVSLTPEEMDMLKKMHSFLWMLVRSDLGLYKKKVVHGMLQSLLYTVLSAYKSRNMYESVKRSRNEEIFFNFYTLLEHNFREERSVQFYADKLSITPKHLSTVVKGVSGRTAGSWIDGYVILAAKVMLRSNAITIQEVSVALNFPNQSFFGKFFKQHVGVSPREYRLKNTADHPEHK